MSGSLPTTSAPADTPAATTEDEVEEEEKREPSPQRFPPYPPYAAEVAPPSVADAIMAGRDLRYTRKNIPEKLKRPAKPPPRPAKPKSPKATDVKLSKRAARAHARCLRRHNAVLTDRLEFMSKPLKRDIIYLWRDYGHVLPADTVARLRSMLDADEPFKPDQAYEYFINLRKSRKKAKAVCVNEVKRDVIAMVTDKRFVWARNATVAFARGIQQRLSRPGQYKLADGMARLSNIVLNDICTHMNIRKPPRCCKHPKSLFMREMADKIAVWIDEILSESEDKMLMMDYDEDDEVEQQLAEEAQKDDLSETPSSVKVESRRASAVESRRASAVESRRASIVAPGSPPDTVATTPGGEASPVPATSSGVSPVASKAATPAVAISSPPASPPTPSPPPPGSLPSSTK